MGSLIEEDLMEELKLSFKSMYYERLAGSSHQFRPFKMTIVVCHSCQKARTNKSFHVQLIVGVEYCPEIQNKYTNGLTVLIPIYDEIVAQLKRILMSLWHSHQCSREVALKQLSKSCGWFKQVNNSKIFKKYSQKNH